MRSATWRARSIGCAPGSASRAAAAQVDFIEASVIDARLRDIEAERKQWAAELRREGRSEPLKRPMSAYAANRRSIATSITMPHRL